MIGHGLILVNDPQNPSRTCVDRCGGARHVKGYDKRVKIGLKDCERSSEE